LFPLCTLGLIVWDVDMTARSQPLLVEFVGMPGSGKSTTAYALAEALSVLSHVVNTNSRDRFRSWAMLDQRRSWLIPAALTLRTLYGGPLAWEFFFRSLRWYMRFRPLEMKLLYDAMLLAARYVWMSSETRRAGGEYFVAPGWLVNSLVHQAARYKHGHPAHVAGLMRLYMRLNVVIIHVDAPGEIVAKRLSERERVINKVQRMPRNDQIFYSRKFKSVVRSVLFVISHIQPIDMLVISGTDPIQSNIAKILSKIGTSSAPACEGSAEFHVKV
jgi:hypothetical protein